MNQSAWRWILLLGIAILVMKCKGYESIPSGTKRTSSKSAKLRTSIVQFAEKYQGKSYKYGGSTPKGFDCSGFTLFVMKEHGIRLPHNSGAQSKLGKKIDPKQAQPGDLLFFEKQGRIFHVALVKENNNSGLYMIHGSSSRGIVVDNVYENSYWKPKLKFARNVID